MARVVGLDVIFAVASWRRLPSARGYVRRWSPRSSQRMWRRLVAARRRSPNMGLRTATSALLAMRATAEPFSAGLACYGLAAI